MANEKSTQLWFRKSREDLLAAKALSQINQGLFGAVVFHCQQSAEKAIKGYLTHHHIRVLKTHDMAKLLDGVRMVSQDIAEEIKSAESFTKYAVVYRYPDADFELPPLTQEMVNEAVSLADHIYTRLAECVTGR